MSPAARPTPSPELQPHTARQQPDWLQAPVTPNPAWQLWRKAADGDWPAGFEAALALLRERAARARGERETAELLHEALCQLEQLTLQLRAGRLRETQIRHLADHDGLTALANRAAFHERLGLALRPLTGASGAPSLALMVLDLDQFKTINDQHGHAAGDAVLRICAARMRHAVRGGDLLGRLGGDEFACLVLEEQDREQLAALAHKLRRVVAAPMLVEGHRLSLRVSLGIAINPPEGVSGEQLLAHADAAMYIAKRSGHGLAFHGD